MASPEHEKDGLVARYASLGRFTTGRKVMRVGAGAMAAPAANEEAEVVLSFRELQDVRDYRQALRGWFDRVEVGGRLVVVVPHAFLDDRQITLPSPWRADQKRLYTPASLLAEVEEALTPNSYRVRWLGDLDHGYDYRQSPDIRPDGESDVMVVLERITPPAWPLVRPIAAPMDAPGGTTPFAFEPARTRVEMDGRRPARRILILKLDHLGDLIMGLPALQRARRYFPDAWIDLVVGSWNEAMARDLGLADRVIAFDAFPRNSTEEDVNVEATLGLFRSIVTDDYDLAIDLRADTDTRMLLRAVKASVKAGLGAHTRFPYLDIALPLDHTRNDAETARSDRVPPGGFTIQNRGRRSEYALYSDRDTVDHGQAIIWGPYLHLDPGDYVFEFHLDLDESRGDGLIVLDIALNVGRSVAEMVVAGPSVFQLPFRVEQPKTPFEARIRCVGGHPTISFGFFGGRLIRRGPGNVLHQSEYAMLLIELVKMRMQDFGMAREVAAE